MFNIGLHYDRIPEDWLNRVIENKMEILETLHLTESMIEFWSKQDKPLLSGLVG